MIRSGVDASTFGVLLTVYTGAYLIAMSAGGALAHRFGVEQALSVSAIIFGATLCALLDASSEAWVAIALIVAGFLGGVVDVLMNAEGARIERGLGRPILARLHAAASAGMALGAILGSLIAAGPAPWAAGVLAALALAGAGVAYHRAARDRSSRSGSAVGAVGRSGLSFAPALIGLGVVVGVSIAAELAASVWSTLLLRDEAPKLAAISGLGAAFFSACQAALRFNADAIRLRVSDLRIIIASFAIAAAGFALVSLQAGFAASVRGFRLDRGRHRPYRPVRLCAGRAPVGGRPRGRTRLRFALQRAEPSARAAGDRRDRASVVAPGCVRRLCDRAGDDSRGRGRHRLLEPRVASAAQGVSGTLDEVLTWRGRNCRGSAYRRGTARGW